MQKVITEESVEFFDDLVFYQFGKFYCVLLWFYRQTTQSAYEWSLMFGIDTDRDAERRRFKIDAGERQNERLLLALADPRKQKNLTVVSRDGRVP